LSGELNTKIDEIINRYRRLYSDLVENVYLDVLEKPIIKQNEFPNVDYRKLLDDLNDGIEKDGKE